MNKFRVIEKYAKENKKKATQAEKTLYLGLRGFGKKLNFRVKKQVVIYPYIIDLFIHTHGIVLEADGGVHNTQVDYDIKRDRYLERLGLLVLRLSNFVIENHTNEAVELIKEAIKQREGYKPSIQFRLNNLENSPFGKTLYGQELIYRLYKGKNRLQSKGMFKEY